MGLYLVAAQGSGTDTDPRRPKYVEAFGAGVDWTAMDFGAAPAFLVQAALSPATEAALDAHADFFTVPALGTTLTSGQVTALQTRLEGHGVPAQWVTTALTWGQVLRGVAAIFQLAQRAQVALATAHLDLTLAQLPAATRTALQAAASSLGFSLAGVTGATTVRQALRTLSQQWSGPIALGDVTL